MAACLHIAPPSLPSTVGEHLAHRRLKVQRTLNDYVEDVHLLLIENKDYLALISAVWDEHAVEGSLAADNIKAAEMIRDKAKKLDNHVLAKEKLATIAKALGVIMRRYGYSRKERRNMVGGVVVEGNNGD
jgi:uncharacterized protein (UPF0128 family)